VPDEDERQIPKLSTGQDSTLGIWRDLTAALFGEDSPATAFLDEKITEQGRDEPVIQAENQVLWLLGQLHLKKVDEERPQ